MLSKLLTAVTILSLQSLAAADACAAFNPVCNVKPVPEPHVRKHLNCGAQGKLTNPAVLQETCTTKPKNCRDSCLSNKACISFRVTKTSCTLYSKGLTEQGLQQSAEKKAYYFNRHCFSHTKCVITTTTSTTSTTSTSTTTTSTSTSTTTTATPACTAAAGVHGNGVFQLNYNQYYSGSGYAPGGDVFGDGPDYTTTYADVDATRPCDVIQACADSGSDNFESTFAVLYRNSTASWTCSAWFFPGASFGNVDEDVLQGYGYTES